MYYYVESYARQVWPVNFVDIPIDKRVLYNAQSTTASLSFGSLENGFKLCWKDLKNKKNLMQLIKFCLHITLHIFNFNTN